MIASGGDKKKDKTGVKPLVCVRERERDETEKNGGGGKKIRMLQIGYK